MTFPDSIREPVIEQVRQALGLPNDLLLAEILEFRGGWESRIFSANLRGKDLDDEITLGLAIRLYERGDAYAGAQKDQLIMDQMRKIGIQVPKVFGVASAGIDSQMAALIMKRIEGKLAREDSRRQVIRQQAEIQAQMHHITPDSLSEKLVTIFMQQPSCLGFSYELLKLKEAIYTADLGGFQRLVYWLDSRKEFIEPEMMVLLHNDFHPENVIISKGDGEPYVLDWGFAGLGDRRSDLAWTLHQTLFMKGKGGRQKYLDDYEDAYGKVTEDIEYFEVLKLTQRLCAIGTWLKPEFESPIQKIDASAIRGNYKIHVMHVYERVKELTKINIPLFEEL